MFFELKTTETRFGPMTYAAGDHYIGKSLELYGEYSWPEVELLAKVIKPGWTVVNGGANIGALTVPIAKLCDSNVKIYAFEPHPEIYEMLKINTEGHENIVISDYALWCVKGTTTMRRLDQLEFFNVGGLVINDSRGTHTVQMTTLDEWLQGEDVNLIFLDIEGCESQALKGAKETIERCRPILYVEDHPEYTSDIKEYVHGLGYFIYEHEPRLFTKNNWKGYPESHFGDTISCNSLCIPKEKIEEYRHVTEDQTKFTQDERGNKLKMAFPRKSTKLWAAIARFGGVGDNLIAASVCKPLKDIGYNVEVITQTPQSCVFENNPYVDKLSVHGKDWPQDQAYWQQWFYIRGKEYGRFANLSHSVEARHGLAPIQTWYQWPEAYRRKFCGGNYLETAHDVMGVPYTFGPLFFPTDEEHEQAKATKKKLGDRPVIAWTLSGTRIDKVYPYASLLIARLIKELGAHVVMLGGPPPFRDYELARGIRDHVLIQNGTLEGLTHASSLSMEDQTWPIRRILTFAAHCDLVIGPDTGPSWSVAFEPVPKIILLSHASEENITKHWVNTVTLHAEQKKVGCWPCHRLHDTFEFCNPIEINGNQFASCISNISVEAVVNEAARLLNR